MYYLRISPIYPSAVIIRHPTLIPTSSSHIIATSRTPISLTPLRTLLVITPIITSSITGSMYYLRISPIYPSAVIIRHPTLIPTSSSHIIATSRTPISLTPLRTLLVITPIITSSITGSMYYLRISPIYPSAVIIRHPTLIPTSSSHIIATSRTPISLTPLRTLLVITPIITSSITGSMYYLRISPIYPSAVIIRHPTLIPTSSSHIIATSRTPISLTPLRTLLVITPIITSSITGSMYYLRISPIYPSAVIIRHPTLIPTSSSHIIATSRTPISLTPLRTLLVITPIITSSITGSMYYLRISPIYPSAVIIRHPTLIPTSSSHIIAGCGSPVVNHCHVILIQLPLKTRRVGQRCTLNLSRAETSPVGLVWYYLRISQFIRLTMFKIIRPSPKASAPTVRLNINSTPHYRYFPNPHFSNSTEDPSRNYPDNYFFYHWVYVLPPHLSNLSVCCYH
ncbi:hypothetical protein TNCV_4065351 [Trichonephila clavipes]|uniref:Uncharacterized protein n=1 Tax=Trichonephila clavipes TaxID=2585209 RepID=A0A8X6W9D5_TRICX|nr:hypothetical protein TNCV_4065351 [Trichonephila clavipes]